MKEKTTEERANELVKVIERYIPNPMGGGLAAILMSDILTAQHEAEERMRERCAGVAGGHVMSMNGLQIQASIEALPSEYPQGMSSDGYRDEKLRAQRDFCERERVPHFAHSAKCVNCDQHWTDALTLEKAGSTHIMACPFCGWSWCD